MRLHVIQDLTTGELKIQGATRSYTSAEYDAARRDAERGDKDALATLDDIREGGRASPQQMIDNCPECQAARARGELPVTGTFPPKRWPSRPRWRSMKRAVGARR